MLVNISDILETIFTLIQILPVCKLLTLDRMHSFSKKFVPKSLIIEFVPKADSQVQRLLATREDIFDNYNKESFETTFGEYFEIIESVAVKNSERYMYYMRKRSN